MVSTDIFTPQTIVDILIRIKGKYQQIGTNCYYNSRLRKSRRYRTQG